MTTELSITIMTYVVKLKKAKGYGMDRTKLEKTKTDYIWANFKNVRQSAVFQTDLSFTKVPFIMFRLSPYLIYGPDFNHKRLTSS